MDAAPALALRPAQPADDAFLRALYASTRADEFAHLGWPAETTRAFMAMQFEAQRIDHGRRHADACCQVIELAGRPVGRLWLARDARGLAVLDISLLPDRRGQGIGAACLRGVLRQADAAGLDVTLQVVHGNPARRLYERLGFVPVGADGVRVSMARRPAAPTSTSSREMHHEQA